MADKSPKLVTIFGRLSFPQFTAEQAHQQSQGGQYPTKSPAEAAPNFQLLVEQAQFDKLLTHVEDVFLPYCIKQHEAGEKRDVLDKAEVKKLLDGIKGDLADQTFNTPFKPVHEKTAPMAPEAVAAIKVIGSKGVDLELKAIVKDESELAVNDGSRVTFPVILPLDETKHSFYPGCYVAVSLNLYAYHNGKHPGFSAGASVAVFKADGDRFGGGVAVDEDEMFLDD